MHKRQISKIGKIRVCEVDGQYIRRNVDEEFTNFGQHHRFRFIPKHEFWIDHETAPNETRFYIDHLLVEWKLMSSGASYKKAIAAADKIEKLERAKSKKARRFKATENPPKALYKKRLKTYGDKISVWIVDGELVRDLYFIDFTEGGHEFVYPFVPPGEVWIDDDITPKERKFVILHELHERNLMSQGMSYEDAHASSSRIEYHGRHFPKTMDKKLKIALRDNEKSSH